VDRCAKDAEATTRDDSKQRRVSAEGEPSIAELERAIVDATLAGRFDVAGVLADRLRDRPTRAGAVVPLASKRPLASKQGS
jgi:hypothetical protein